MQKLFCSPDAKATPFLVFDAQTPGRQATPFLVLDAQTAGRQATQIHVFDGCPVFENNPWIKKPGACWRRGLEGLRRGGMFSSKQPFIRSVDLLQVGLVLWLSPSLVTKLNKMRKLFGESSKSRDTSSLLLREHITKRKSNRCFDKLKAAGFSEDKINSNPEYVQLSSAFWDTRYERKISEGKNLPVRNGSQYRKLNRLNIHLLAARSRAQEAGTSELKRAQAYYEQLRKENVSVPWPRCNLDSTVSKDVQVQADRSFTPIEPNVQPQQPSSAADSNHMGGLYIPEQPIK